MTPARPAQQRAAETVTLSVAHCLGDLDLDPMRRAHTASIVVDVIRATTTLTVMFERGMRRVYVARDVAAARQVRASAPHALLAGEVNAVAPFDFDHGNSPEEWGRLDATGREALFSTTNGARGLHAAMGGGPVYAGSLRNASAVCIHALSAARRLATPANAGAVTITCSGQDDQPAADDSLCAGWLLWRLQREAEHSGLLVELGPGAQTALDLLAERRATFNGEQRNARDWLFDALAVTPAAHAVLAVGLGADIAWCADVDAATAVPLVAGDDVARALLVLEKAPPSDVVIVNPEELR